MPGIAVEAVVVLVELVDSVALGVEEPPAARINAIAGESAETKHPFGRIIVETLRTDAATRAPDHDTPREYICGRAVVRL